MNPRSARESLGERWLSVRAAAGEVYRVRLGPGGSSPDRRMLLDLPVADDVRQALFAPAPAVGSSARNAGGVFVTAHRAAGATATTLRLGEVRSAPFVRDTSPGTGSAASTGLTLQGYGAVFDSPTMINDIGDQFRETVARGAFRATLRTRTPVLQFDHGRHAMVGSLPIGAIKDLREDERGLYVSADLTDNWLVQPVRDAIRDGGITGMSFQFAVLADKWQRGADGVDERTILAVDLYELGPVVFPAYGATTVGVS